MINITLPETAVNTEYLMPYSYGTKSIILPDHEDSIKDCSLAHTIINGRPMTDADSALFYTILYRLACNKGNDKQIPRADFQRKIGRSARTVTTIIKRLEEYEWIIVDRVTNSIDGAIRTHNTYNINWKKAYEDLGSRIYGKSKDYVRRFIHKQIKGFKDKVALIVEKSVDNITAAFETCRQWLPTLTSSSSLQDKDNNNSDFFDFFEDKKEEPYCWDSNFAINPEWEKHLEGRTITKDRIPQIFKSFSKWYTNQLIPFQAKSAQWEKQWIAFLNTTENWKSYRFIPPKKSVSYSGPEYKDFDIRPTYDARLAPFRDVMVDITGRTKDTIQQHFINAGIMRYNAENNSCLLRFPEDQVSVKEKVLVYENELNNVGIFIS